MIRLEVRDWNSQVIEAVLDGVLFYVVINWNSEGEYWTLMIRNAAYRVLVAGISLVPNYPLLWQFRYPFVPAGELMAVSAVWGEGRIPRDGFVAERWQLLYLTERDLIDYGLIGYYGRTTSR